jgi:hypothetical protein
VVCIRQSTASRRGSRCYPAQIKALYALTRQQGPDLASWIGERCRVDRPKDLTLRQASELIDAMKRSESPVNP